MGEARVKGLTVWFTGLPSSGKTTISTAVFEELQSRHWKVGLIDGDAVRQTLCRDLGFSKKDRDENVARVSELAKILTRRGIITLVSMVSPYRAARKKAYYALGNVLEVYVKASIETCERRDVKGLYKRARAGEFTGMTGLDDPYEPPRSPGLICNTDLELGWESVEKVVEAIKQRKADAQLLF
jgi:adenylyl-sulfate kinase